MTGADVQELQSMLIGLGYDLGKWGADGDFGSDTQSAVKKFQQDYRLDVDGAAGPDTLEALKNAYTHQDAPETGDTQERHGRRNPGRGHRRKRARPGGDGRRLRSATVNAQHRGDPGVSPASRASLPG